MNSTCSGVEPVSAIPEDSEPPLVPDVGPTAVSVGAPDPGPPEVAEVSLAEVWGPESVGSLLEAPPLGLSLAALGSGEEPPVGRDAVVLAPEVEPPSVPAPPT
ncbi:MAG: hypothetical protein ACE37F_22190 [Nannocystaceae bacterium]|nr:hypothetical protein [bacterium]